MTIPLDDLGGISDDGLRRDRWGRLMVVPPGETKPVGYTRHTTVAKATDEGGGLMPWKATMTVCGVLKRPGLRAQWEALIADTDSPWYAGDAAKAECKRLVEESAEAGGATDRRDQGKALHAITALVDSGRIPMHLSPETARDIAAYTATLDAYGIEIVPGMVEFTVVLDSVKVGGSPDRLVRVKGHELPMIADLKTGADLSYSGGSFSVQVAGYAHGEDIYVQGPTPADDERCPMPAVDQHEGLVIWLPAGEARCEIFVVDLDAGWEGFQLSLDVRRWRQRRGLLAPFSQWTVAPPAPPALRLLDDPEPTITSPQPGRLPDVEATVADIRQWLQERIDIIGKHSDVARMDLARSWPQGMPTLRSTDTHTNEQLLAIEAVVDAVEGRHTMAFGPKRPGRPQTPQEQAVGRLFASFPGSTVEHHPSAS